MQWIYVYCTIYRKGLKSGGWKCQCYFYKAFIRKQFKSIQNYISPMGTMYIIYNIGYRVTTELPLIHMWLFVDDDYRNMLLYTHTYKHTYTHTVATGASTHYKVLLFIAVRILNNASKCELVLFFFFCVAALLIPRFCFLFISETWRKIAESDRNCSEKNWIEQWKCMEHLKWMNEEKKKKKE